MNKKNLKVIGFVLLVLLIDIFRPFDYYYLANTTFLALIALSFYNNRFFIIFLSLLVGFTQDSLIFSSTLFYAIEFPLIVTAAFLLNNLLKFIKTRNHPLLAKVIIAAFLILVHSFLNCLRTNSINFPFLIYFFSQSFFVFFLIDNILEKTLKVRRHKPLKKSNYAA